MIRLNVQEIKISIVKRNVRLVNIRVSYLGYVELRYRLRDLIIYQWPSMCLPSPSCKTITVHWYTMGHAPIVISSCPCHCFCLSSTSCRPSTLTFGPIFGPWPPRSPSSYALISPAAYQFRICSTSGVIPLNNIPLFSSRFSHGPSSSKRSFHYFFGVLELSIIATLLDHCSLFRLKLYPIWPSPFVIYTPCYH